MLFYGHMKWSVLVSYVVKQIIQNSMAYNNNYFIMSVTHWSDFEGRGWILLDYLKSHGAVWLVAGLG